MARRAKVFTTANRSQKFEDLPSLLDQLVDIDSVQTVSNKTLVGGNFGDLQTNFYRLMKAVMLGQISIGGMIAVSPGLAPYVGTALGTV